jgi:hypothetical protein
MSSRCEEQTTAEKHVVQNKAQRQLSAITAHFIINFQGRSNICEHIHIVVHGNEACVLLYLHIIIIIITAVAQWLRYCTTSREVVGLIPVGVIGIFH